jgi:hypothetical protein
MKLVKVQIQNQILLGIESANRNGLLKEHLHLLKSQQKHLKQNLHTLKVWSLI